jgi:hypothetical protein
MKMGVEWMQNLDVRVQPDALMRRLHLDRLPDGIDRARQFVARMKDWVEPRAAAVEVRVSDRDEHGVWTGGGRIESRLLARFLGDEGRIVAHLVTLGPEADAAIRAETAPMNQYGLHEAANLFLDEAQTIWKRIVGRTLHLPHLSSIHPGGLPDWSIEGQRVVFGLLVRQAEALGVRLTETVLMVPQKTVSGIFFPSSEPLVTCRLCSRLRCPSRRAPFDPMAVIP